MQLAYQVRLSTLFHSNLLWSPLSATWSRSVVHPRSLFSRARLIEFIHRNLHVKRSITIDNVRQWCIRTRSSRSTKLLGYSCVCGLSTKPKVSESEYRAPRPRATRKLKFSEEETYQKNEDSTIDKSTSLSNKTFTLPNILCMARMGVTPVVGYLIVVQDYKLALGLCALSSLTDFLDGWIARQFNSESKLGAILDPLADKLLVATLTFTLTYVHLIPLWLTGLILSRDSLIILGGLFLRFKSLSPPITWAKFFDTSTFRSDRFKPTLISKVNTGFQLSLVVITLASPVFTQFFLEYPYLLPSLQVATGITTLWSGLNYLTRLR